LPTRFDSGSACGSYSGAVLWDDVIEVLDALEKATVRSWTAGGWGVDLLVGAETRAHRDLDLAVHAGDYERCMATLEGLGYVAETDWLPLRVEVAASGERWVDVHPVRFDVHRLGIQGDPAGVHFVYPPEAFTTGWLAGRAVPCLSVDQQRLFHSGYALRPQDEHDLELLDALSR
jgi:lincosamide nucleotidyltransferase A/C/D/E